MKKCFAILLIVLMALSLPACGNGKENTIVGTWEYDLEATLEANIKANLISEEAAEYARRVQATNGLQIVYTFTANGKVTYTASAAEQSNTETGEYRIEGNRLYMPQDSVMEFVISGKHLTLTEYYATDDGGTVPAIVVLTRK